MSYARRLYLDPIFSERAVLLRSEPTEGSRPAMLFDVGTAGNVADAFDAVYRALRALTKQNITDDIDRADAVLAALGIVYEQPAQVVELRPSERLQRTA